MGSRMVNANDWNLMWGFEYIQDLKMTYQWLHGKLEFGLMNRNVWQMGMDKNGL